MSESWRNILERAAGNLSIDLDPCPAFGPSQARSRGSSPHLRSFIESRDLLARQLQMPAPQPAPAPRRTAAPAPRGQEAFLTYAVTEPSQDVELARLQPGGRAPWRNLLAAAASGIIIGASAYFFLGFGLIQRQSPPADLAALTNVSAAGEQSQAAMLIPAGGSPALSRASEDALLKRASDQMNHGDSEGARALYEMLARYGSQRGTFNLAETYDPKILARHQDWRLNADLRAARELYKKAAGLGSLTALERLKDLDRMAAPRRQITAQAASDG